MSASLVGSEMCIRDRLEASDEREEGGVPTGVRAGADGVAGMAVPTPPPVSYTHLTLPTICSV
eukprot:6661428-Alexandrium_andersonii.AAC.1